MTALAPVAFHRVIVRSPSDVTILGAPMVTPPDDAFDPAAVRVTPVSEVRAGDTIIGTVQPHYGPLLEPLDRAQWVCYTSHASRPQTADARSFDPSHCWLCTHNFRNAGRDRSCWTVDGCTSYRPDSLLLVIPPRTRRLGDPVTSPALHPDILIAKYETIRCWSGIESLRKETLGSWQALRIDGGALFLSGQITGPNPGRALHRFADRHTGYLTHRPQQPGDQAPTLDVSVPGREACVWRTGGVWVELWHPIPATTPTPPVRPVLGPPKGRGLLGVRLPVGRRRKTPTA